MLILRLLLACSTPATDDTSGGGGGPVGHDRDKVAPTVDWVAPLAGATVSGTVAYELTASDNVGLAALAITLDDVAIAQLTAEPWAGSFDSTLLPNGEHDLAVVATDAAGNEATSLLRVLVDNGGVAPDTISFLSPTGESVLCGSVPIEVYSANPTTSVTLYIDGSEKAPDSEAPYYWTWDSTGRADGEHVLAAVATLADGSKVSDRVTVEVGNAKPKCVPLPSVRITEPDPGELLGATQTVEVESAAGDLRLVRLDIDGVELHAWNTTPYTYEWDTSGLAEGAHVLGATATDTKDQTTRTQNLVYVDSTNPRARITSPAFDAIVQGDVLVTAEATDASGVASARLYADGRLVGGLAVEPWEWTWDSSTSTGEVELELIVTDMVGRTASDSVTVIADRFPDVHSSDPVDGDTVSGLQSLAASASDDDGIVDLRWLVDGVEAARDSSTPYRGTWDTCAEVGGAHTLVVRATDTRGQVTDETLAVTVDQPQQIEHDTPSGVLDPTQTVRSWVADDETTTLVTWSIDGVEVARQDAGTVDVDCPMDCVDLCLAFEAELDVLDVADGAHILTIEATNALGDTRSLDVDVEIDRDLDDDGAEGADWGGDDCDDLDGAIGPGIAERCDGLDQDCDGDVDEDFDADGDGYESARHCTGGDDCDDADFDVNPGATEVCDGVDNDCDGYTDLSGAPPTSSGTVTSGSLTATTSSQFWGNVYVADADVTLTSFDVQLDPGTGTTWFAVYEADSPTGTFTLVASALTTQTGGLDWYSSGTLDVELTTGKAYLLGAGGSASTGYRYERGASLAAVTELTPQGWLKDTTSDKPGSVTVDPDAVALFAQKVSIAWADTDDVDGDLDGETPFCGDCDDTDPDRASSIAEECDGVDNDCDGAVPGNEADADGDGDRVCESDCDDTDPDRHPSAWEECDGIDNDCDGVIVADEADADGDGVRACVDSSGLADCDDTDAGTLSATFYADVDGDGYGASASSTTACPPPAGYVRRSGDCDVADATVSPGATEVCDSVDNDCDGVVDDGFDADGDGIGACDDCDDGDASVHPGAVEVCGDLVDDDCDGVAPVCRYAGSTVVTAATHYLLGELGDSWTGSALAGGDTDGDGSLDVAVGGYQATSGARSVGAVYVVPGPLSGDVTLGSSSAVRLLGESADDYLGASILLTDLDADGTDDATCTAYGDDDAGSSSGAVYVVPGGTLSSGTVSAGAAKLTGATSGDTFGRAIAAGDVNGDGEADLLVGAIGVDSGGSSAGAAYLFYGSISTSASASTADALFIGQDPSDQAGYTVGLDGDFDGDGRGDVRIGAPGDDDGGSGAGAVYVVYDGTTSIDLSLADAKYTGGAASDGLGTSAHAAADLDGDGWPDLVLGASAVDTTGTAAGAAYVFWGPLAGSASVAAADVTLFGAAAGDAAGFALATPGDLDGDGAEELLVSAHLGDDGASDAGQAYLLYGPLAGSLTLDDADASFLGESLGDYAGYGLAAPGDVDGDGEGDFLIGAPYSDLAGSNYGAVYVMPSGG